MHVALGYVGSCKVLWCQQTWPPSLSREMTKQVLVLSYQWKCNVCTVKQTNKTKNESVRISHWRSSSGYPLSSASFWICCFPCCLFPPLDLSLSLSVSLSLSLFWWVGIMWLSGELNTRAEAATAQWIIDGNLGMTRLGLLTSLLHLTAGLTRQNGGWRRKGEGEEESIVWLEDATCLRLQVNYGWKENNVQISIRIASHKGWEQIACCSQRQSWTLIVHMINSHSTSPYCRYSHSTLFLVDLFVYCNCTSSMYSSESWVKHLWQERGSIILFFICWRDLLEENR